MGVDLGMCKIAPRAVSQSGCDWCGGWLTPRQTRWCSGLCMSKFRRNHVWKFARAAALGRDGRCVRCGSGIGLEVNHVVPLAGRARTESCFHHLGNLEVLCHRCHVVETAAQRGRGELPSGWGRKRI
jgi:5-methylcytosine-specific restriction endonuclease McrA